MNGYTEDVNLGDWEPTEQNRQKSFSFLNMLDYAQLQRMQDRSCEIGQVFGFCLDSAGNYATKISGDPAQIDLLFQYIEKEQCLDVCRRIKTSMMEDLQVEDTGYPWIKIAAVDIKLGGKSNMTWCYCAILSDCLSPEELAETGFHTVTTTQQFMKFLDLCLDINKLVMDNGSSRVNAEAEIERSRSAEQEMSVTLKRLGAITEVVQLLDCDDAIEAIMADCAAPKRTILCAISTVGKTVTSRPKAMPYPITLTGSWVNKCKGCGMAIM